MPAVNGDGAVALASVIAVLKTVGPTNNVSIAVDGNVVTLVKDGIPEVYVLPDRVPRPMVQRFANKYSIRIEYFYHPEMCCQGNDTAH